MGTPSSDQRLDGCDYVGGKVEAQVVAGREVAEPLRANSNTTTSHFVDDCVHHWMCSPQPLEVDPAAFPVERHRPMAGRGSRVAHFVGNRGHTRTSCPSI